MAEFWVLSNVDNDALQPTISVKVSGGTAEIVEKENSRALKRANVTVVECTTATEAINAVRQTFPGNVAGKTFAVLKSSFTVI